MPFPYRIRKSGRLARPPLKAGASPLTCDRRLMAPASGRIRCLRQLAHKDKERPSRSGKVTETPVTGSMAVRGGALPATSDQV